ncbi:MAG TPA: nitroreductase [Rhodothermales bacterium]|nr:nitroreductase [Rhodothermales bacterium]
MNASYIFTFAPVLLPMTNLSSHKEPLATVLRSRRTIHLFEPMPPPRKALLDAIELARWAPNHRLTEPWRFYVIGPETADAIAQLNAALVAEKRGARAGQAKLDRWRTMPGWFAVTSRIADNAIMTEENYAACCCAVQNLQLSLWSQGLGAKWGTGAVTRDPRFFELLGIDPTQEKFVGLFWYGYPADIPTAQRKPVAEIVTEIP